MAIKLHTELAAYKIYPYKLNADDQDKKDYGEMYWKP